MQFVWGHTTSKSGLAAPPGTSQQIISLPITTLYMQPCEPSSINPLSTYWHLRSILVPVSLFLLFSKILSHASHFYEYNIQSHGLPGQSKITLFLRGVCKTAWHVRHLTEKFQYPWACYNNCCLKWPTEEINPCSMEYLLKQHGMNRVVIILS